MTLEEAIEIIDSKGINPWMAWGVIKWNDGYCIVTSDHMKRHPDLEIVYIKKGNEWPKPARFGIKPLNIK